ncbi:MAG TPA: DUF72 domain-containing protein [Candidatus Acidoferrales bacterium]|nr:DUF72 domain-containing protein [Candidatus Acidoferrales bacterium]
MGAGIGSIQVLSLSYMPRMNESKKMPREHRVLVGPAGWSYSDWNGIVYPSHRPHGFHEASYLAQYFDTIEINTSFYQPLRPALAAQWIERVEANPRFLFTAKLWQRFTHEGTTTSEDEKAVREGFDVLMEAGMLGAVLLQFPFSFHNTPENLQRLNQILRAFQSYPLAVEVRHSSWAQKDFYELLHSKGIGFCNIDQPVIGKSISPSQQATSRIGYVRLHGRRYDTWFTDDPTSPPEERYNYLYSEKELEPWVERIRHVAENTGTTFVVTNNHYQGKAIVNALQLINLLTRAKVKVPEALRHLYPLLDAIADEPSREPTLFPMAPRE